jgi:hypothetical protein
MSPTTDGSSAEQQPQPPPLRSALKSEEDIERPCPPSGSLKGTLLTSYRSNVAPRVMFDMCDHNCIDATQYHLERMMG